MARIFLAGASGAIGRPLTAMLVAAGHEVTGTTRNADRVSAIEAGGATAVVADILDAESLTRALEAARPAVVIHQVTDLATGPDRPLTDARLESNAHVREVGTANIVNAAVAVGVRRVIAQSIAWLYLPGPEPHTEDESIVPADPAEMTRTLEGVVTLERLVTRDPRFEGLVLRYGRLYGPGTWTPTPDTPPTVHVDDAARAALLSVDHGEPGIYHIAEDGPVATAKARGQLGWTPVSGASAASTPEPSTARRPPAATR